MPQPVLDPAAACCSQASLSQMSSLSGSKGVNLLQVRAPGLRGLRGTDKCCPAGYVLICCCQPNTGSGSMLPAVCCTQLNLACRS